MSIGAIATKVVPLAAAPATPPATAPAPPPTAAAESDTTLPCLTIWPVVLLTAIAASPVAVSMSFSEPFERPFITVGGKTTDSPTPSSADFRNSAAAAGEASATAFRAGNIVADRTGATDSSGL